jgi:hypothetical protein
LIGTFFNLLVQFFKAYRWRFFVQGAVSEKNKGSVIVVHLSVEVSAWALGTGPFARGMPDTFVAVKFQVYNVLSPKA